MLEKLISEQIGVTGTFNWQDFEYANPESSIACDSELKGLSFFKGHPKYDEVYSEYLKYNINRCDSWQSWDAVFTLNGVIYLVEVIRQGKSDRQLELKLFVIRKLLVRQLREVDAQIV